MARLQSVSSTWKEYGGWVVLMFTAYILWAFRGVFTSLGNVANDKVGAAVADAQADAEKQKQQSKVQAATGSTTKYSDAQLATFAADAETLAGYLGQLPGIGNTRLFKDQKSAFGLIKGTYARLNLYNNKPWSKVKDAKAKTGYRIVSESAETKTSQKNAVNYKVLAPFYHEVTDGRNLVNDFRDYVNDSSYTKLFKWIL